MLGRQVSINSPEHIQRMNSRLAGRLAVRDLGPGWSPRHARRAQNIYARLMGLTPLETWQVMTETGTNQPPKQPPKLSPPPMF